MFENNSRILSIVKMLLNYGKILSSKHLHPTVSRRVQAPAHCDNSINTHVDIIGIDVITLQSKSKNNFFFKNPLYYKEKLNLN